MQGGAAASHVSPLPQISALRDTGLQFDPPLVAEGPARQPVALLVFMERPALP